MATGLGWLLTLVLIFFHTRASAHNLYATRVLKADHCFENDEFSVEVKVSNTSLGHSVAFTVTEHFTPSYDEEVIFCFPSGLAAKSVVKKNYTRKCDGGLCLKDLGTLQITV